MKKPRPHKAAKSRKRARKARGSVPSDVRAALALASATAPEVAEPAAPARRRSGDWQWHQAAPAGAHRQGSGPPSRKRAKGPPPWLVQPQKQKPRSKPARVAAAATKRDVATLVPATVARRAIPPRASVRSAAAARRRDRVAAVALVVPVLFTAALMLMTPRAKPILDETALAGLEHTPIAAPTSSPDHTPVAFQPLYPVPPQSRAGRVGQSRLAMATTQSRPAAPWATEVAAVPPFVRPPETLAPAVLIASHDLNAATVALAGDVAALIPPYRRPPEALVASIPLAEHDLAQHDLANAVVALARDAAAAAPPFQRPPEGLVAVVPAAEPVPRETTVAGMRDVTPAAPTTPPVTTADATAAGQLCRPAPGLLEAAHGRRALPPLNPDMALSDDPERFGLALAAAAKAQTQDLVIYNARYMSIAYPRGDVPVQFGVCTDVVIRAYRALDIDLQELVHESRIGPSDANIDHRRTDLLRRFFATHGEQLAVTPYMEDYLPGDIVTYYRPQNRSSTAHIAVVTDVVAASGRPMIAHNRGWGVQLEDALFVDQMTGHYRYRGRDRQALVAVAGGPTTGAGKRPIQRVAAARPIAGTTEPLRPVPVPRAFRPPMGLGVAP